MFTGLYKLAASLLLLAAIFMFYEGVPGLSRIPFVSHIPIISTLSEGRVGGMQRQASVAAQQAAAAKLAAMVAEAEKAALAAQLSEAKRQQAAGAQAFEEFRKRAAAQDLLDQAEIDRAEKANQDDDKTDDGAARVTDSDIEWLRLHDQ